MSVHAVGGHSAGLQFVRVKTARGFVVLASDVTHFYENMASHRPFTTAFHIGEMLEGFDRLLALAPDESHIVPGHDPLVMKLYPAPSAGLLKASRCGWMCRHRAKRRAARIIRAAIENWLACARNAFGSPGRVAMKQQFQ